MMKIAEKLAAISTEVPYIKKRPKENLPYPYVAHDDVTERFRKPFQDHGVIALPYVVKERQEGNRCVLEVSVRFVDIESGESVTVSSVGHGTDSQDKGAGKAYTYAIKMIYLKTFMVPTGEKDIETEHIEQSFLPAGVVRKAMDYVKKEDDVGLYTFTERLSDEEKIALWKEVDSNTKKKMRELIAVARATLSMDEVQNQEGE